MQEIKLNPEAVKYNYCSLVSRGRMRIALNYCYECGLRISPYQHFCHTSNCSEKFFSRFKTEKEALTALAKITRAMKKDEYPHFISK